MKSSPALIALIAVGGFLLTVSLSQASPAHDRDDMGPPPERVHPLLRVFDVDQDGRLSGPEMTNATAVLLKHDLDQDGVLSLEELVELLPPPPPRGDGERMGPPPPR